MSKLINYLKRNKYLVLITLITFLTFFRMIRVGMFSTQDFHLFRLFQFDKCVQSFEIPCRWAPDAGLGYGEPVFNYYGQLVYAFGELFNILGFGVIGSVKILFSISLLGSSVAMYFLSKRIWNNHVAGFLSALLYVFAPYRAVDVWVRGALPEAFAFLIIPLIFIALEKYFEKGSSKEIVLVGVVVALLVLTHNLSALLFLPVVVGWVVLRSPKSNKFRVFWGLLFSALIALGVAAFYILPLVYESGYVNLNSTTQGYFDFHNHYTTLKQLFVSNYWGYGASNWGDGDGLSMAVGYIQWILGIGTVLLMFLRSVLHRKKLEPVVWLLFATTLALLFLTHNKSTFVWESLDFMRFIQFPWRFLAPIIFCLSLMSGYLGNFLSNKRFILIVISVVTVVLNAGFFREDIWYKVDDQYYFSGAEWLRQRSASIGDYWPVYGPIPKDPPEAYIGNFLPDISRSNLKVFNKVEVTDLSLYGSRVTLPVAYFPGWTAKVDGKTVDVKPDKESGLVALNLSEGVHKVELRFTNTPIRFVGNIISILTVFGAVFIWIRKPFYFWRQ